VLAELDPDREAAVCRELTKAHEEVVRGTAAELAERYADDPPRGEVVLVVAAPSKPDAVGSGDAPPDPAAVEALRKLVDAGAHPRKAATVVASLTGTSANSLYQALTSE
jgi:16S rRNA (cytidine1402-2'-O)-methyltransferase